MSITTRGFAFLAMTISFAFSLVFSSPAHGHKTSHSKKNILNPAFNVQTLTSQGLSLYFKFLPPKLVKSNKYWLKWQKTSKFSAVKTLKAWKFTTNLHQYQAKNKKQLFKIKAVFKYNNSELKKLKKKNPGFQESQLVLQFRNKKNNWRQISKHWQNTVIKHNSKKNTFTIKYLNKFKYQTYYFRITATNKQPNTYSALGTGMNNSVAALAVYNNELYVGGNFTTAGGAPANYIAKWDGSSWSALGSEVNNTVRAFVVHNNELYAGGRFTTAGGNLANYIAKWDGSSWSALGSGMNNQGVAALTIYNNELFAGGYFTTAGGNLANYIAKWDGSSWSALGSGVGAGLINFIWTLTVYNNELYVGGDFTTAGGNPANYIAKWDGSSWSALGTGVNSFVYALAVYDNELYIGGSFTSANSGSANRIAKWNGSSWSALGTGMNQIVDALSVYNNELCVGGFFTLADNISVNRIAKYNGSSFSALGSGINNLVRVLSIHNNELYIGGDFTTAGDSPANYIASWYGDFIAPTTTASPPGGTYASAQTVTLTASDPDSGVVATYYTTDSSTPTTNSTQYTSPIEINQTATLKFFSIDNAGNEESVKTEEYIIEITPDEPILFNQKLNLNNVQKNKIYYSVKTNTRLIFFVLPKKKFRRNLYIKIIRIKNKYLNNFKKSQTYPSYVKVLSNIKKSNHKNKRIKFRLKINYSPNKLKNKTNLKPKNLRVFFKDRQSSWQGPYNTYHNQPLHRLRVSLQNYHRPQSLAASTKVLYFPSLQKIKFVLAGKNTLKPKD